jgi:hypothetical protein
MFRVNDDKSFRMAVMFYVAAIVLGYSIFY